MRVLLTDVWQLSTSEKLGYLGLSPFLLLYCLSLTNIDTHIDTQFAFVAYSAAILSFLSGTIWQTENEPGAKRHQVISNAFCLIAFVLLLLNSKVALVLLAVSYLVLYSYEKQFLMQRRQDYLSMRFKLTVTVSLIHLLAFFTW